MIDKNSKDWEIIRECIREVEEVQYEIRKGVPQTFYVGEIVEGSEYWSDKDGMVPVPEHLIGYFKMDWYYDLRYTTFPAALKEHDWEKCKRVEVIDYEYQSIE